MFIETFSPVFERNHKDILGFKGIISGAPGKFLIDPGGEIKFLSESTYKNHPISTIDSRELAEMTDSVEQKLQELVNFVRVQIETCAEPMYFFVNLLKR